MWSLQQNHAFSYEGPILKSAVFSHEHVGQLHISKGEKHPLVLPYYLSCLPIFFEFFSAKVRHAVSRASLLLLNDYLYKLDGIVA